MLLRLINDYAITADTNSAAEIFEHIKAEVEALVFPGEEDS